MGFFYIPDSSTSKQNKERSSSVVISVIEGNATARELEMEFNIMFGDSWRCTARPIGPNQYIMRFPNLREVERVVYYGDSMRLKSIDATVRLSTWTASVGAKAILQKAWVRISNIPLDKRTESIVFYVGSLVGVSLDLDASTLHKPEFVRVLIGCRDVDLLPAKAEGCLGDNFYDFFFEVDKVVVGGPSKQSSKILVGGNIAPSPKRARMDQSLTATDEASEEQFFGSQADSVRQHGIQDVGGPDLDKEQVSDDDSTMLGNELLIESMAREHEASAPMDSPVAPNKWLVPYPLSLQAHDTLGNSLPATEWPSLPVITNVSVDASTPSKGLPAYIVQSPNSSSVEEIVVIEDNSERFSQRIQAEANVHVMEKVANVSKKRTLEAYQPNDVPPPSDPDRAAHRPAAPVPGRCVPGVFRVASPRSSEPPGVLSSPESSPHDPTPTYKARPPDFFSLPGLILIPTSHHHRPPRFLSLSRPGRKEPNPSAPPSSCRRPAKVKAEVGTQPRWLRVMIMTRTLRSGKLRSSSKHLMLPVEMGQA
uniref:Uncharacterized protein n=1 Tax=Avena sativa TaxID=4498 RepID=A0ACD5WJ22_AVESA